MNTPSALLIHQNPLSYQERLASRGTDHINLLVIHCTELPDLQTARVYGERIQHKDTATGNSGHYYIDKDGSVHEFVGPRYVAHHVKGYNAYSLGIELVNQGRYPNWFHAAHQVLNDPYPSEQIDALIRLINKLSEDYPSIHQIAGHEDLDLEWVESENDPKTKIKRKVDPGPLFPWERVMGEVGLERLKAK